MSLTDLREEIDSIDTQLVELLARRQKITGKVGAYKKTIGKAIYDPVREAELIAERRTLAESLSVSPDLIEDLLRRIMRESYQSQHNSYRCLLPNTKVVVVGGAGALGSRFVDMFNRSGYEVVVFEESDWPNAGAIFSDAKLVIISVPIQVTESVISQLPKLNEECILADLTSLKHQPLQAMLEQHNGPVVGLHPMFGPDVPNFVKQVVVVCDGRDEHKYQWLIEQLKLWGAILEVDQAKQHDSSMEIIQAMRHFTTYVYGRFLAKQDPNLDQLLRLSSPIYRLELAMTGRLFAQNSQLYADIIYSAEDIETLAESFCSELTSALSDLKNKDKVAFKQSFEGVANWFGDTSSQFLVESRTMLKTAHDAKSVKQLSSK
ncbi:bifunctional chorismate mutase/prephenate dehydrogenase [Psychrosphaera haliotis]